MPLKKSIGTRIFGLAIFLLTLTIVLVCFLLWEVAHMEAGLQTLAHGDIPLASSFSRLDSYGLDRRVAFERMFGAMNGEKPDEQALAEAKTDYETYNAKLRDEMATARELFARTKGSSGWRSADLAVFAEQFDQVEAGYERITARQQEILELQSKGERERALIVHDALRDLQTEVRDLRSKLQDGTALRSETMARDALQLQTRITFLTVGATASTVLLGLIVAAWVTQGLVRPVRLLIGAMGQVQNGQLDVELPVRGADEIGALTAAFNYFVSELRAKARIKETFGKYVDPRVLDRVLSAGAVEGTGERHVMTVSFGDLVGFTNCSERLTPTNMVRFLNRHFGLQTGAIQDCQGIVDKFMGDAVMAFWGPPFVAADQHARLACRAALAQLAALETLRAEISELTGLRRDAPHIDLRLGIAAGEVIVGNIGGDQTRAYTVIGDTVNVASRIEAVNRIYNTNILVNEQVARDADGEFAFRQVDIIAVKGRREPVRIFELLGPSDAVSADTLAARDVYEKALKAYQSAEWKPAQAGFEEALRLRPTDAAAHVMIERIAVLSAQPVGAAWDGVWKLTEK